MTRPEPLIFDLSRPGHRGVQVPQPQVTTKAPEQLVPAHLLADQPPPLPEVGELEAVRHFVRLSQQNWAIDTGFYPLGSCTMKYNPKINEVVARYAGFARLHPYQPLDQVQGALALMHDLERCLAELVGLPRVTFQPAAGAHGEMTGLLMIRAYHRHRGDGHRDTVLVPDSAHGTNPATAAMMGYKVVTIPSNERGLVSLNALKPHLNDHVAALMLTNPSTLGLFEEEIREIADAVHAAGGLLYYDGANMNAIMGWVRPGDMGFDVIHLNLHKTMTTPHGGGGPGAGPVLVRDILVPFLPAPTVEVAGDGSYFLDHARPLSIGQVKAFYGHFGMLVRAYTYILSMGGDGLKEASMQAVLNANYLRARLHEAFHVPYDRLCMHEFVLSASKQKAAGANAMAIAKRLIDYGFHPPTVYFPLVVPEAMMIEPTETESLATLDAFADALLAIDRETRDNLQLVLEAPHHTPVQRIDEVRASRQPNLRYAAPTPEKSTVGV